jgi:hypothetical protein
MKTLLFFLTFIYLSCFSCSHPPKENKQVLETPKALQEKSSFEIKTRYSSQEDLAESLYKELVDKTPELKQLEKTIDDLNDSRFDSIHSFNKYNDQNNSYFNSVNEHANSIKDSLLREKMKTIIAKSLANYNSLVSPHTDLVAAIEKKKISLTDLHTALIITKTLPVIAQYQKEHLPPTKPLAEISKQQDAVIEKANTLLKN